MTHKVKFRSRPRRVGSSVIRAAGERARGTLTLTTGGGGEGMPEPGVNDRILLDARAPLQACTTEAQAKAIFTANGDVGFNPDQYVNLVTNFDGAGTKAIRCDWTQFVTCSDAARDIKYTFPDPKPTRLYIKLKHYMGKHPNDPTGLGTNNRFQICNAACGNAGRKMLLAPRAVPDLGSSARFSYTWTGPAPARLQYNVQFGAYGPAEGENRDIDMASPLVLQDYEGTVIEEAFYLQAASAAGVNDGVVRHWFNGQLFVDGTLPMEAWAYHRFSFPTVIRAPEFDQSEYWWDIVAWAPEGF